MFNKKTKNLLFVFSLCYNLLLFKCIGVTAITEQQRLEIQRLKSELSEALDNDNTNVAAKGVIVQPSWTQDKSGKTETVNVEVTAQNRNEAAALRDEIKQAVSRGSYATAGAQKPQDIKSLEASLNSKERGKEALLRMEGKPILAEEEHLGAGSFTQNDQAEYFKAPNTITANINDDSEIDMRKLQRLEVSKRRTREVLILKYIEEDFSFDLGSEVNEWKHIVHAGQEYFIGRRVTDLLIVRKEAAKYERAMVLDIGQVITYIETYTYWNLEQEQQEGVILIATKDKVLWYRANHVTKLIELYWEWLVGNIITGLTHFTLDSKNYLTISSNQSFLAGHYALNIYQFKLEAKEFWIAQRLQLEFPCEEVTILNTGRDVILTLAQNNTAKIYTFNPHEAAFSHIRFQLKKSVAAEGISTIAGFKMGGRSYLALTGYQPQILLYQQGDFIPKTLLGHNFGLVELFFPIPVRTYRDDLILLVQHRVDFSTHSLTVVETLIWDGEAFETSIPVPCHLGEHVVYGVSCMLDIQRDEGLKGAALLKRGGQVSVIVPRHKAESGLFRFHTELLAKNSELLDLQEIFQFLKDWVKEQDDLIAEAEAFLQIPNEDLLQVKPDSMFIETLTTPEFELHGKVGEIYLNDHKWTPEDSEMDLALIIQNIEDLDKSLNSGRQRRNLDDIHYDDLEFDEVWVDDLEVENVNDEPYFIQNGELKFDGLAHFSELEVLEQIENLQKRQVNDDLFILNGDLQFDKINGVAWADIKNNLVFKTQSQNFKDLEVKGEVFVEDLLTIKTLNTLNFPDDYMLTNGPATSTVTAEKHFANTLTVNSVDTNGLVNDKNPGNAITLTDAQDWLGMATFKHLEVAEVLELQGEVHGREEQDFPQNPTLRETNIIEANCHFNELTVAGVLVLKGELDDQPLGPFLKQILVRRDNPADEIIVPSKKTFNQISFPIDFQLENNTINEIPVQDFVTLNTNQSLNITSLEGYVYFYNLTVNGSYDGVRIEDVLRDVILLDKPVDLSTTEFIFPEILQAKSVTILDSINTLPIKDNLQSLQEDLNITAAEFENLQGQQADLSSDILGPGTLNNVELHSFMNETAWHEPPIKGNLFLNELFLSKGIQTDELHGIGAEFLLDFLNQIEELPDMVLNGQIQVEHITVTGDVQVSKLNGLLFDEDIQLTTIKLQHPNFLSNQLTFRNRLDIRGHLNVVGDFRGHHFPALIDDIVLRTTNSCIEITAPKSFVQNVEVLQNTEIKALNGISMDHIAWKTKPNNFKGSVHIKGNLFVQHLNLNGNINNFNWQDLQSLLYFDENLKNFVLKNTWKFETPLVLQDLTVLGDLNDVKNLSDFFDNLIYKNDLCLLKSKKTFTGRVSIERGALIRNLNGHDLVNLFNNFVFIHGPQPINIQGPISFEDPIYAKELQIQKSLELENLSGCSLREWLTNSLRVDRDENITNLLHFAGGSIDGNSLLVNFLNDIDLSRIITLNTPQTFNESVKFSKVLLHGFITSKGLVNNVDLEQEFNNTLMNYGHQHILTPLTIQSITVLGDLTVRGLVNSDKDLKDVATLQEDLVMESPLYFESIQAPQVFLKDLVTGIDFEKWFASALKYQHPGTQNITGSWSTKLLTVRKPTKEIQYLINGFKPWQLFPSLRLARNENNEVLNEDDEICILLKQIWQDLLKKPVFIKHIEEYNNFTLADDLKWKNESFNKIFVINENQEHYLLLNIKCETFIYKWLMKENKFVYKTNFESGPISEIEIIPAFNNSKKLQFITNSETTNIKCDFKNNKKWRMENEVIVLETDLTDSPDFIYKTKENNSSLWVLHNETLQELDLNYKIKQNWQLPADSNKTRYRFVPLQEEQEVLLTNGENLLLLANHLIKKSIQFQLNNQEAQLQDISTDYLQFGNTASLLQTNDTNSSLDYLQFGKTASLLKPNDTVTQSIAFAEFKPFIERILSDLKQRLNQQVNITQLSIPESDLFDEHTLPDFLSIMKELQNQHIFGSEVFNVSFKQIKPPENPSQVLADRVVQITWPVVLEIEKIHSYLKTNSTHDHPLCNCIEKSLGFLINDVLILANKENNSKINEDVKLHNVIERIRKFERDLDDFLTAYANYDDIEQKFKNLEQDYMEPAASNLDISLVKQNQSDFIMMNSFLPGYKQGEILLLEVGSSSSPQHLWAVTNTNVAFTADNNPGLYLYRTSIKSQLFQVIPAVQPRSLQQLRLKQETLLMFIQDCCQVKILKYHGSQGFITFAEINRNESIKQILTLSLPFQQGNIKYFLLLLMEKDIKFYEFVLEGYSFISYSQSAVIPFNCL